MDELSKREPEMRQSNKDNQQHLGSKVDVGINARSRLVQITHVTTGKVYKAKAMAKLNCEDDRVVFFRKNHEGREGDVGGAYHRCPFGGKREANSCQTAGAVIGGNKFSSGNASG